MSWFHNFKLGVAGLSDSLGITDDAAAREYADQVREDAALSGSALLTSSGEMTPDERGMIAYLAGLHATQQGALEQAAEQTTQQIADGAGAVVDAAKSALSWLPWAAAGAGVLVLGAIVVGVAVRR